ncbi:serine/threonine dehydratase [Saccharothrix xinjiangensis]|uniref:Serine/threonine dehydratase n=1 Tax=Saccharothrix xinjiangensis TaxID=204798 RepID=A0ABV9XXB6_9PSEU
MNPDVAAAADRIRPYARRTPLWRTEVDGRPLVLKLEHLQLTGSFKLRGALNALLTAGSPDSVVTASGGNHGLGVAEAARQLGLPATVFVPLGAPEGKVRRIEAAGAKLVRHGETYAEAVLAAREAPGHYVEAYDSPDVIAGQGTVAAEVVADAPDVDVIAVAVGGGGLAAGTALGSSGRPTVAVEPERCRALNLAFEAGRPVDAEVVSVAASALGATRVGEVPFEVLRAHDVRSVLVSDAELLAARDRLWEDFRLAVEPAAAVPFAAWLAGRVPGEAACVVLCGANTDWAP